MELLGGAFVVPAPTLSANLSGNSLALSWPATNGSAFTLYSSAQLSGTNWKTVIAPISTNNGQITQMISPGGSAGYFRLQYQQ
jgi:hypothetical protein